MKDQEIPPLDPKVRRLLDAERTIPAQPADVRARALERARASLSIKAAPPPQKARPWRRARYAAAAGIVLALGAGALAAIQGWRSASSPPSPSAEGRSITRVESMQEPRAAAVDPTAPVVDVPRAPDGASKAKVAPRSRSDHQEYAAEIRLLQQTRDAVAAGQFQASLARIAEHARRFPSGRLVEEREALRVRALSKLGRSAEARRAAEAFRTRFPRSVLLPRVTEMQTSSD